MVSESLEGKQTLARLLLNSLNQVHLHKASKGLSRSCGSNHCRIYVLSFLKLSQPLMVILELQHVTNKILCPNFSVKLPLWSMIILEFKNATTEKPTWTVAIDSINEETEPSIPWQRFFEFFIAPRPTVLFPCSRLTSKGKMFEILSLNFSKSITLSLHNKCINLKSHTIHQSCPT